MSEPYSRLKRIPLLPRTISISRLCRGLFIARPLSPSNQAGAIDSEEVSERTDGVDSTGRGHLAVINIGQSCCGRLHHVISSNDVDGIHHTSSPAQRGRICHCGGLQFVRHASLYFVCQGAPVYVGGHTCKASEIHLTCVGDRRRIIDASRNAAAPLRIYFVATAILLHRARKA